MNNQFILNYQGSKFRESKYLNNIDFSSYDTIIESFGGSFGFSRYLWSVKNYKNKKYIVYDTNKELIDFYNYLKNNDITAFLDEYNKTCNIIFSLFSTGKDKTQIKLKDTLNWINENIHDNNLKFCMITNIKSSPISRIYIKNNMNFSEMIKTAEFIYADFSSVDFSIYDKNKTLLYFDPPYAFECNSFYKINDKDTQYKNFWERLIEMFNENDYKCLLIHSDNVLVNYVLKKFNHSNYNIKYGNTGNVRIHNVYYKIE